MSLHSSTIRVPASTSNLGSGFDTLGMALGLYNDVTVSLQDEVTGKQGFENRNFFETVGKAFFDFVGKPAQAFSVEISGRVPRSRGLGSSVTVRAGIFAALNEILATGLDRETLAREITMLEGHPDNAVASVFGGLTIAKISAESWELEDYLQYPVPENLSFAILSPDFEVKTNDSRDVLPASLPFKEVVESLNSLSFFLGAFLSGKPEKLSAVSLTENIHQPYRLTAIPGGKETLVAAKNAGAFGAWLSGSGSSLIAMVSDSHKEEVKTAMEGVFSKRGIQAQSFLVKADNEGLRSLNG